MPTGCIGVRCQDAFVDVNFNVHCKCLAQPNSTSFSLYVKQYSRLVFISVLKAHMLCTVLPSEMFNPHTVLLKEN